MIVQVVLTLKPGCGAGGDKLNAARENGPKGILHQDAPRALAGTRVWAQIGGAR
jgi:hypothetical protein